MSNDFLTMKNERMTIMAATLNNKYVIVIEHNGSHFLTTKADTILTEGKAKETIKVLKAKFPEGEGYTVRCNKIETTVSRVNIIDMMG